MSPRMLERGVRDYEYRQRVRRYKPSSLVPLIAAAAARYWEQQDWLNSPYRKYTPWALADAARVSLAYGTEFNRADATEHDLLQILNAYSRFDDPFLRNHDLRCVHAADGGRADDLAGPGVRDARPDGGHLRADPAAPADGVPATRMGHRAVRLHAPGVRRDRPAGLGQRDQLCGPVRPGSVRHPGRRAHRPASQTGHRCPCPRHALRDQHRAVPRRKPGAAARADPDDHLRRFTYNPLRGHPLLTGFGSGYLCPIPHLAWAKAAPWGVYFTGLSRYGEQFARDLGHLFEQYIGRQLRLLPGAQVMPEITYGPRNDRRKTIDWIVVLPEVVLLVEVKSAIPAEPVRLGTPDAAGAVLSKLGKAFKQIDITAQLIADRDTALAAVPADRPVLGMAVTLEPFHMANAQFDLLPATRTPVTVADAAEIENLVMTTDTPPGRLLLDRAADELRSTWSLDAALEGHARDRNPVLDEAWDSYPWASAARAYAESPAEPGYTEGGHPGARVPEPLVLGRFRPVRGTGLRLASSSG